METNGEFFVGFMFIGLVLGVIHVVLSMFLSGRTLLKIHITIGSLICFLGLSSGWVENEPTFLGMITILGGLIAVVQTIILVRSS